MNNPELKSCPFCGHSAEFSEDFCSVQCTFCGAEFGEYAHEDIDTLAEFWNRRAPGWQPMDTAPKDGTEVLILNSGGFIDLGRYLDISGGDESLPKPSYRWRGGRGELYGDYSIHEPVRWQPLPAAPESAE